MGIEEQIKRELKAAILKELQRRRRNQIILYTVTLSILITGAVILGIWLTK